jgi:hypothetical protein
MRKYQVQATSSSPYINFDPDEMFFEIRGESYPENCWAFYSPMFDWFREFLGGVTKTPVEIDMEIIYFNSSSSKTFMDFFDMLDEHASAGRSIVVNWRYHEENESAMECGEEFMEDVDGIRFNLVEYGDTVAA